MRPLLKESMFKFKQQSLKKTESFVLLQPSWRKPPLKSKNCKEKNKQQLPRLRNIILSKNRGEKTLLRKEKIVLKWWMTNLDLSITSSAAGTWRSADSDINPRLICWQMMILKNCRKRWIERIMRFRTWERIMRKSVENWRNGNWKFSHSSTN